MLAHFACISVVSTSNIFTSGCNVTLHFRTPQVAEKCDRGKQRRPPLNAILNSFGDRMSSREVIFPIFFDLPRPIVTRMDTLKQETAGTLDQISLCSSDTVKKRIVMHH